MKTEGSRVIVVLGMHRGGTSAVTRALSTLGVVLGDDLHPPGDDNPKGFWEDRDCLAINEELLRHLGSAYDRLAPAWRFEEPDPAISALRVKASRLMLRKASEYGPLWGFKDPRTSRLLRFWQPVIQACGLSPSYVIALRNPLSVALSLQKRNQISAEKSYFLWLQHILPAVLDTVGFSRVVVNYDLLLEQPSTQLHRMAKGLGLGDRGQPVIAGSEQIREILDPELRHSEFAIASLRLDHRVPEDVATACEVLARAAKDDINLDEPGILQGFEAMDFRLRSYSSAFQHVNELEDEKIALYTTLSERSSQISTISQAALEAASENDAKIARLTQEVSDKTTQIALLTQGISDKAALAVSLKHTVSELENRMDSLSQSVGEQEESQNVSNHAIAEKETQIVRLRQAMAESTSQVHAVNEKIAEQDRQIAELQARNAELKDSLSWQVTAPLRWGLGLLLNALKKRPGQDSPGSIKQADVLQPTIGPPLLEAPLATVDWTADYVEDTPPPPEFTSDVRVVAFYLPQFHPIPENDQAWGKGFTEWTNVARARPQFEGHYQPHLPSELGFYDLRVKEVQFRQVELAKRYGIGAFCFHFYWFGGKLLLELPIRQYLDTPELDLPFCLCWANENWTRKWDGADEHVIIAQNHSPDDDIAFIEHAAQYMRDPRYLSVHGRPVLLVYQPSLLPNGRETAERWRRWARQNGLGELYLISTQSLEVRDPTDYGFDAAAEFPPNIMGPPAVTNTIRPYDPAFSGIVYDWSALVERSRRYLEPNYKLFRGVCPSWDNTPRRAGRGATFLHSSPTGYREWLENAVADTRQRFKGDERLIFVNAWNEWAEGAHLEPDQRYGYAWLQATRKALLNSQDKESSPVGRVVVVTHDAYKHGAQVTALSLTRELVETLHCKVEVVCLGEGPLKEEFAKYAKVHDLAGEDPYGPKAREVAAGLFERGFTCALVNTTVSGHFLVTLKKAGLRCVALVHELRELILSFQLETHAQALAEHADRVVFAAPEVRDAFFEFGALRPEQVVIRPQGVQKRNFHSKDPARARRVLRQRLGLPEHASIVLGVGYGDLRKGLDYFLDVAAKLRDREDAVHFVWVGPMEAALESQIAARAKEDPGLFHRIHFEGYRNDLALYYGGADVFGLTSREDPFPNVVLEAMGAGLPIVAFAGSGGSNALIDEGAGENVPMGDCGAFAQAILRILGDAARRDAMARRGRDLIAERFSFRKYAFDLLELAGVSLRRVSVVVPNYNYGHYLADRLYTILDQTYPIYELIFLDDASRDNSRDVAQRLLERSGIDYRIISNDSNSGSVFRQWKLGVELARGEIVWIAEADDMSERNFLATVLLGFENPEVVLSYCESKQIDRDGLVLGSNYQDYVSDLGRERWQQEYVNDGEHEIRNYLAVKNTIPNVSATLMRRDELIHVLSTHNDICEYQVAGDWKTYIYLLANGRLAFFPQSLNLHRRHQSAITAIADESLCREIGDMQAWIASRFEVPADVALTARSYLNTVREVFGLALDDAGGGREEHRPATA